MTKLVKYLIAGAAVLALLLAFSTYRACDGYDKYSVLKGQYEALSQVNETQKAESIQQIVALRNLITQKDEKIRNITSHIEVKEGEISTLHAQTDNLEFKYTALEKRVHSVDTLEKRVDNLETQVTIWKGKFTIAEGIIANKDEIIFNINGKYEAAVKIGLEWKSMYESETTLNKLLNKRLNLADKKIASLKFTGTVKGGLVGALAGVVLYGVFKK